MSLVPKTAFVRVRLDQDLLERFQLACDARRITVSHALRQGMLSDVQRFEQTAEYKRLKGLSDDQGANPSADTLEPEKMPPAPVKTVPKGKNREQRRADKKRGA